MIKAHTRRALLLVFVLLLAALAMWWLRSESTDPSHSTPALAPAAPNPGSLAADSTPIEPGAATAAAPSDAQRVAVGPAESTWVVRGRVLRAADMPYPGAQIRLQCLAGPSTTGTRLHEGTLTAGPDGTFAWPVPPPSGTVTLLGEGAMPRHRGSQETALVPRGLPPPQDFEIWAAYDRVVKGTVLDAAEQPIPGAWVGSTKSEQPVDADGTFRLDMASGFGGHRVQAGAPGYTTVRQSLAKGTETELTVHFTLQPGLRITGRVIDEQGLPIAGATVATFYTLYEPGLTDADGRFVITNADLRERHSLFARKAGYAEAKVEVDGKNPADLYELVLRRGVRVHACDS